MEVCLHSLLGPVACRRPQTRIQLSDEVMSQRTGTCRKSQTSHDDTKRDTQQSYVRKDARHSSPTCEAVNHRRNDDGLNSDAVLLAHTQRDWRGRKYV